MCVANDGGFDRPVSLLLLLLYVVLYRRTRCFLRLPQIEKGRATVSTCCAFASDHPPLLFPLTPCTVYLADRPPSSSSSPGGISWAPETFDPSSCTIDVTYAFTDHGRLAYERAQKQNSWWGTALVLVVVVPLAVMMVSAVKGAGSAEPERQPEEAETERQPKRQSGAPTGRRQPLPRAASARKG